MAAGEGTEVGKGVLGAGHFRTQTAAITHFPQAGDPLMVQKYQMEVMGGDAKTWLRWAKTKTSAEGVGVERRVGLGASGAGGTVSPLVPEAGGHASFQVESSESLGQSSGVRGAGVGVMRMGAHSKDCTLWAWDPGAGLQTRPSSPGASVPPLPEPRTEWS